MSNHETPQQRRTRLIEQYTIAIYTANDDGIFDFAKHIDRLLGISQQLADAVIAATPQEPEQDDTTQAIINRLNELCELAKDVFIR